MSRSSTKKARKLRSGYKGVLLSALAAATLSIGVPPTALHAAGYVYQQHLVNAGVLVTSPTANPAPYVFYVLNNRPDVKPTDVTLINPLAQAGVNPNTAAYWQVLLNTVSDSQLAQYNVLYLRADNISFGPVINERLRRFVDNGGQLIVEYGTISSPSTGLFAGTRAVGGSSITYLPPVGSAFLQHPILSQPYFLSPADVLSLGPSVVSVGATLSDPVHAGEFGNIFSPVTAASAVGGNNLGAIAAAQVGAGQVVVSGLNFGGAISVGNAAMFVASDLYKAPAVDLKLLANILAWSGTHPNQNKTSHGNASGTGLASFSQAWQAPAVTVGNAAPSAATIWGNFVYAVDSGGALRAYDAYPSENLTGTAAASGAEGVVTGLSKYPLTSYDEIWNQNAGAGASSPTLAAINGANYIFVERNDGSIASFNAVTGTAGLTLSPPASGGSFGGAAPAPTYYDGRLYAGQANGTLHVYDLNEGTAGVVTGVAVPLNPNTVSGETVTGPPAVGTLADGDTNVLVAVVSTNYNTYSVLLGARNEPLRQFTKNGSLQGYSISRQGRYDLTNIFADTLNPVLNLQAYDYNGNVSGFPPNNTAPNPQDPLFPITNNAGYYTDWNMDFAAATGPGTGTPIPVDLNFVSAEPYGEINSTPTANGTMSAAAIDRRGNYYYTENYVSPVTSAVTSYLVGVNNAPLFNNVHLKFRFLLPTTASPVIRDADNVNYTLLNDYKFAGAPVVDNQGNVYVAATNGTKASVLCFRGDQQVSAVFDPLNLPTPAPDLTQATITQPDEGGGNVNTIQRGPDTNVGLATATYGQFIPSAEGISFYNFGKRGRTPTEIAGNLTEPQYVTATDTSGAGAGTRTLFMHTNLAWFVNPFPVTGTISGLSQVGSSVFLSDGTQLYKLSATPQVGAGKLVSALPTVTTLGAGAVGTPPSIGGSVMAVNGINGLVALTRQVTVIADSNRILGVDGGGSAVWAVDATTRSDTTSTVSTKVPFSHPTALSQFAVNDYLVADTGNNRCVRFDSAGNVQWELTRFQDLTGLMAPGQPLTLSQPSSVQVRIVPDQAAANVGGSFIFYLVADSGNNRILEVADRVDKNGAIVGGINHVLTWVSHTGDKYGRQYRYGNAAYYTNPTTPSGLSIAATVMNTRLGALVGGQPGPLSSDTVGGSIVVFNYPQPVRPYSANAASDLVYTTAGFYTQAQTNGAYAPYTIRNPRFLQLSPATASGAASPNPNISPFDFLYADDNGAFDLSFDTTKNAFVAGPDRLHFVPADYQAMAVPAFGVNGTAIARGGFPFIPTCVQALGTDSQGTNTTRRYLITQSYSQGELGTPLSATAGKVGGEIFEIDVNTVSGTSTAVPVGGFGNKQTLSHPDLTGPLTQPTYGVRLP